jgi:hypothetical protein
MDARVYPLSMYVGGLGLCTYPRVSAYTVLSLTTISHLHTLHSVECEDYE